MPLLGVLLFHQVQEVAGEPADPGAVESVYDPRPPNPAEGVLELAPAAQACRPLQIAVPAPQEAAVLAVPLEELQNQEHS